MSTAYSPGFIAVGEDAVYALLPGLDKKIVAHIEAWRDSVPAGTTVTISKMLCCSADCGCPADGQLTTCKGKDHGMPLEIVMAHLFPVCTVDGVAGLVVEGPLCGQALGHPKMVTKLF